MRIAPLCFALCLTFGASACGQKGPLVLPDAAPKHKPLVIPRPKTPKTPAPDNPSQTPAPAPSGSGPATSPAPPAPSTSPSTATSQGTPSPR